MNMLWQPYDIAVCSGVTLLAYALGHLVSSPFTTDPHTVDMIGGAVSLVPAMAMLSRQRLRDEELERYDVFD